MNAAIADLDIRTLAIGLAVMAVLLVVATFLLRNMQSTRRTKMAKVVLDKNVSAINRAESVILEAQSKAASSSGRDVKRPFDLVNWHSLKRDLGQAGLPKQPIFVFLVAAVTAVAIAAFVVSAPIYPLWAVSISIYPIAYLFVRKGILGQMAEGRRLKMLRQLVQFIESVQRAVTVGTSAEEAVSEAIGDTENPLRQHLVSIQELLDLGYDFVDAINLAADRINLPEFDIFVASLAAQSNSGGSIGEVLREVVDITRSRLDLQNKISTLTAEGRFNALLLGALPISLTIYLRHAQPDYFEVMWQSTAGTITFFATLGLAVLGSWLATKIASVKV